MAIEDIRNFVALSEDLATAGQPSEQQVQELARAGFEVVVNLGLLDPRYCLADEVGLASSLGMTYHHIPVDFTAPQPEDLEKFFSVMDATRDKKVFVHCAANYRVSGFIALYGQARLGWSASQADAHIRRVWEPNDTWRTFLEESRQRLPDDVVMRIEDDDVSRPQVIALIEEHLRSMYELSPPDQVFAFDASRLRAPEVRFWTAWKDGTLLGCAALKELSPTQGEVKSMRTPASLRRRGAGRSLLNHILQVSRERGYQELFLETGRHPAFAPAQALYRSAGFRECGPFGTYKENGNSVFMSLRLRKVEA